MKKGLVTFAVLFLLVCGFIFGAGTQETETLDSELDTWLNGAQLGRYAPDNQDWAQIEARAKQEGKVVVYSCSSRIFKAAEAFTAKYGIEVEAYDIGDIECIDKFEREQQSGIYTVDVLFTPGAKMIHGFLPEELIYNFVPEPLAEHMPQEYQNPLLVHSLEGRIVFYNAEANPEGNPIDNQWDLTRPEWKGKVLFKNPGGDLAVLADLCNYVAHSDELKAAYERKYGTLVLSEGIPNAGYEYIYRLLKNDLVLMKSGGDVAKGVGLAGQKNPPIGFTGYAKIRDNESKGTVLAPAAGVDPFDTQTALRYLAIGRYAPHPDAAKLFIAWMMGSSEAIGKKLDAPYDKNESGRLLQGRVPWFVPGDYAPINGYPIPKGAIPLEKLTNWAHDMEFVWENVIQVQEFWMSHGG